jgi:CheY-like chemotaxis protein
MILIVEDEIISRRALRQLLRLHGYEAQVAGSAEEAIELIAAGHLPQLALVDINLPGMSGVEFVHRLHRTAPSVPCVFMTANDQANEERGRAAETTLHKPLDVPRLLNVLHEIPRGAHARHA